MFSEKQSVEKTMPPYWDFLQRKGSFRGVTPKKPVGG